jgi:hypothetical protein
MKHHPFEAWPKTLESLFHRLGHRGVAFETK